MYNEKPISFILFEAIDENRMFKLISKTLGGDKYISLQQWNVYSFKDNDTFKQITNKYHREFYFNTVELACITIFGNADIDNNIYSVIKRNNFLNRNFQVHRYVKPVFFSKDPENDFDTFKCRWAIETKFPHLKLKYYIMLPFINITSPTYVWNIQFNESWDRTKLPSNYQTLIQNLYRNEFDIKILLITPHIFEIYMHDESKLSCVITSCSIHVTVFRPVSLVELDKLYNYVYIISYILISPSIASDKMKVIWKFIQGVYNNISKYDDYYSPYRAMWTEVIPPFTNTFKHNTSLKNLEIARLHLGLLRDFNAFDVVLKSIQ